MTVALTASRTVAPGVVASARPMSLLIIAAGIVLSNVAVVAIGASRSSKPSFQISTAAAPASKAFSYFCVNGQVPR